MLEARVYDDDRNLLADGQWAYIWNAEKRLVKTEPHLSVGERGWRVATAAKRQIYTSRTLMLEFVYDYQGCRFSKTVVGPVPPPGETATGGIALSFFIF
jgi:hypothetical protein